MIETAIEIMRDRTEDGVVRMKAVEYLSERLAGKAPLVIEAEMTATMIGGRDPEELSDAQIARVLALIDAELGDDEPAQLMPARVIDVECVDADPVAVAPVVSSVLSLITNEGGDQ